jgi:hypothetical protein
MAVRDDRARGVQIGKRGRHVDHEHLERHVDRALDVSLAGIARIARLPRELLGRADVDERDRAFLEEASELVPRHERTSCRNRCSSSLNSAGFSSGERCPAPGISV